MTQKFVAFDVFWKSVQKHTPVSTDTYDLAKPAVRQSLMRAGWIGEDSDRVGYSSASDLQAAVDAASAEVMRVEMRRQRTGKIDKAAHVAAEVRDRTLTARAQGGKMSAQVDVSAAGAVRPEGFNPMMAKVGDGCPKCGQNMRVVSLVNGKTGIMCANDRVVLPIASAQEAA